MAQQLVFAGAASDSGSLSWLTNCNARWKSGHSESRKTSFVRAGHDTCRASVRRRVGRMRRPLPPPLLVFLEKAHELAAVLLLVAENPDRHLLRDVVVAFAHVDDVLIGFDRVLLRGD